MNDVAEGGEESNQKTRDMVRSQNDVYMVVNNNGAEVNSNNDDTERSVEEGRLTVGELQRAAINICTFILNAPVIERELVDTDVAKYYPAGSCNRTSGWKNCDRAYYRFTGCLGSSFVKCVESPWKY